MRLISGWIKIRKIASATDIYVNNGENIADVIEKCL